MKNLKEAVNLIFSNTGIAFKIFVIVLIGTVLEYVLNQLGMIGSLLSIIVSFYMVVLIGYLLNVLLVQKRDLGLQTCFTQSFELIKSSWTKIAVAFLKAFGIGFIIILIATGFVMQIVNSTPNIQSLIMGTDQITFTPNTSFMLFISAIMIFATYLFEFVIFMAYYKVYGYILGNDDIRAKRKDCIFMSLIVLVGYIPFVGGILRIFILFLFELKILLDVKEVIAEE